MTIQDRLSRFAILKNISIPALERKANWGVGTASRLKENSYSSTFAKLAKAFPDLNIDWLKTGEGEMLKKSPQKIDLNNIQPNGGNFLWHSLNMQIGDPNLLKEVEKFFLKNENLEKESCMQKSLLDTKDELIASLRQQIADRDEKIAELKERLDRYIQRN